MDIILYCIMLKDMILTVSFASWEYIIFDEPTVHKTSPRLVTGIFHCLLEVLITIPFNFDVLSLWIFEFTSSELKSKWSSFCFKLRGVSLLSCLVCFMLLAINLTIHSLPVVFYITHVVWNIPYLSIFVLFLNNPTSSLYCAISCYIILPPYWCRIMQAHHAYEEHSLIQCSYASSLLHNFLCV